MLSISDARYVDVLALPRVPLTFGTSLIGRAAYALVFLPLLYAVTDATGSIAQAGLAIALYGAGAGFLAPVRAWLLDHFGARRVIATLVILFAMALTSIAIAALTASGGVLLLVLSAAAGSVAPPLGPTMRVAWQSLAPEGEPLKRAMSLDAVVEELLYLGGPAIAGLSLAFASPGAVLLGPAAMVLVGGLLFVATPAVGAMGAKPRTEPDDRSERPLILELRFVSIVLPVLTAGGLSGAISVAVPKMLSGDGGSTAAGVALGCFAGGSAVGGLLFGRMRMPGSPFRQLAALVLLMASVLATLAFVSGAVAVAAVLAVAGLFFSPIMIVGYMAAGTMGGDHRQNSATTWVNTGHNLGSAAGSAVIGVGLQLAGAPTAMIWTAGAAAVLLLIASVLNAYAGEAGK
ncbi:MFS transporter [Microbacterium esteraromaticum]|uniref:MFS transporter n=1 Tax=Microbacterium esteraromaticum TaxID=57043 RepID=A0A7D8AMC7_9MICO|nr:MFS transporter [Microbacterium esteraromaticum]QMU98047.1 MFS transporter [Microbacterium esteraromaticum]